MVMIHQQFASTAVPVRLRILFLVHGMLQFGFGFALVVIPEILTSLIGWGEPFDPVMSRLAGAFLLGLALGQGFAYRAETWDQVWFLYVTILTESVVGLIAVLYMWGSGSLNAAWLIVPLFVFLTPAFAYYLRYPLASSG